jgi:hypothetical protein
LFARPPENGGCDEIATSSTPGVGSSAAANLSKYAAYPRPSKLAIALQLLVTRRNRHHEQASRVEAGVNGIQRERRRVSSLRRRDARGVFAAPGAVNPPGNASEHHQW